MGLDSTISIIEGADVDRWLDRRPLLKRPSAVLELYQDLPDDVYPETDRTGRLRLSPGDRRILRRKRGRVFRRCDATPIRGLHLSWNEDPRVFKQYINLMACSTRAEFMRRHGIVPALQHLPLPHESWYIISRGNLAEISWEALFRSARRDRRITAADLRALRRLMGHGSRRTFIGSPHGVLRRLERRGVRVPRSLAMDETGMLWLDASGSRRIIDVLRAAWVENWPVYGRILADYARTSAWLGPAARTFARAQTIPFREVVAQTHYERDERAYHRLAALSYREPHLLHAGEF
jgi:hypothetical protein